MMKKGKLFIRLLQKYATLFAEVDSKIIFNDFCFYYFEAIPKARASINI